MHLNKKRSVLKVGKLSVEYAGVSALRSFSLTVNEGEIVTVIGSNGGCKTTLLKRKLLPDPEVEIHPDTAKEANIKDGDWIWIETPKVKGERVKFKAKLTSKVHPKVVHAPHGWWFPEKAGPEHGCFESNINVIIAADPPREEICGSVPARGSLRKIYK